jgi:transposase
MKEVITSYVGLDIHKDSIAIAVAEVGRSAPRFVGTTPPEMASLCKALTRCAKRQNTLVVYEAGPCGYGWVRHLSAHGWRCEVISPAHIIRKPAEKRLKTDRLDAVLLARESRAGNLVKLAVPDERDEAIRDLSRAREDASAARLRARLQLKAMLLRHGHAYQGKTSWTAAHERATWQASSSLIRRNRSPSTSIARPSKTPTSASSGSPRPCASNANTGA